MRVWMCGLAMLAVASATAGAADRKMTGKIVSFECGDNCYLTITPTKGPDKGKEVTGLCAAPACDPWNEIAEMPANMVGRRVAVTIGKGTQIDGGGNVMGKTIAFKTLKLLP